MIRTSVFVGASLDGFIARPDDGLDWLMGGEGEEPEAHGFEEFFATVDALLMGRRTYDVVLGLEPWYYGDTPLFVLSSKPIQPAPAGRKVERIEGEPDQVLAQLEARGMKHVYVDGGRTIQSFLRAGRIDRMTISTLPILIGEGIPLFGPTGRDIRLKHVATRTFKGGMVQNEYEVIR
jgi:dihydrofolate reductase